MTNHEIIANYINGNKEDFRAEIKKLSTLEILNLVSEWGDYGIRDCQEILKIISANLQIK